MYSIWSGISSVGKWCYNHKSEIGIAAAVGTGAYVAYRYLKQNQETEELMIEVQTNRARTLERAQREFDFALLNFLPTLRTKIDDVIDVNGAIRKAKQIKQARGKSDSESELSAEEYACWEEIKVATVTLLVTSSYMLCIVVVLLRVQMHILARHSPNQQDTIPTSPEEPLSISSAGQRLALYHRLLSHTYKHVFTVGLEAVTRQVQEAVRKEMQGWTVTSTLSVSFHELKDMIHRIRRRVEEQVDTEQEMEEKVDDDNDGDHAEVVNSTGHSLAHYVILASRADAAATQGVDTAAFGDADTVAHASLWQTWDIVESSLFDTAYTEAVEAVFDHIFVHMQHTMYDDNDTHRRQQQQQQQDVRNENKPAATATTTLPLVKLLPRLRSLARKLLDTQGDNSNAFLMEALTSRALHVLCAAVFDADAVCRPSCLYTTV